MIRRLAQYLFIIPLGISILASGYVRSDIPDNPPTIPIESLKEDASNCIEEIRKKQERIREEINLIKDLIRQKDQNQNPQNPPEKDKP